MTMNTTWGYSTIDREWKSPRQLIHYLVTAANGGGNYLLNVGPDPDGRIPFESVERLRAMGRWLDAYGESIYGSEPTADRLRISSAGRTHTKIGNTLYLHCWRWPGEEIVVGGVGRTHPRCAAVSDRTYRSPWSSADTASGCAACPPTPPIPSTRSLRWSSTGPPEEHDRFGDEPGV